MTIFLLACTPSADSGEAEEVAETSSTVAKVETVSTSCESKWEGQVGFDIEVGTVVAELRVGPDESETHDVPFAGMDKETGKIYLHEAKLSTESDFVGGESTAYSCADGIVAMFRAYDGEGAIMACAPPSLEEIAAWYSLEGCPA